ncbi:MAG: Permease for cytosine/purine, uracil, thiamine, allantoin [Naasia sp.]|nr:Permease for cytosine/purine, uracil, thiamine, allantoin [Naasia sp.]
MSDARDQHRDASTDRDDAIHDDDELAAAIAAELERFTPSGPIPIIPPAAAEADRAPRSVTPEAAAGAAAPDAAAEAPPAAAAPAAAPAPAPPALPSSAAPPAPAPPSPEPEPALPPRRPAQPSIGAHRRTEPLARRAYPGTGPIPTQTGPIRTPTGPVRPPTGPTRLPTGPAPTGATSTDPGQPGAERRISPAAAPACADPGRRSTFRTGDVPRPDASGVGSLAADAADPRFASPVPHFAPDLPPFPPAAAPPEASAPPAAPGAAFAPPAPSQSPRSSSAAPIESLPADGDDPLARLQALQARLARVRLDESTYREWEESLRHLGDQEQPHGAHAAPPSPTAPRIGASVPPLTDPNPTGATAFAPPPVRDQDLLAMPVDAAEAAAGDDDVIDAELVEDDAPRLDDKWTGGPDLGSSRPVPVQPGPMPASSSAAFLTMAPGPEAEPAEEEPEEVAPLHPEAIDPLTLDEGVLNTGTLPIITSALDRDLDDDVDDVATAPGPLALGPGPAVGPAYGTGFASNGFGGGAGSDTGAVPAAPRPSAAVTGAVPLAAAGDDASTKVMSLAASEPTLPSPFLLEPADLHPSPVDRRLRRPVAQFWLWFAPNASALTVAVGAVLVGLGLSLRQSLVAVVIGVVFACVPLAANVMAVKRTGQPAAVVSRASFGLVGNIVPTVLLLLVRLAWGVALVWLIASAIARLVEVAGWDGTLSPTVIGFAVVAVIAAVSCVIAVFGHGLLAWVHLLLGGVSLLVVGVAVVSTWSAVDLPTALAVADGTVPAVIGGAIGVFSLLAVAWTAIGGELARYQQPRSSGAQTISYGSLGAALPALLLLCWGVLLAASSPALGTDLRTDPIAALAERLPDWYGVPLLLALVLGLVAALATVLYSSGLTLPAAGVPLDRRFTTVISAVVAAGGAAALLAASPDIADLLRDLVPVAAVPVAVWTGVIATELFLRTRPLDPADLLRRGGRYADVRWGNLATLVGATIIGIGLLGSGPYAPFAGWIWTLIGADSAGALASADLGVPLALLAGLVAPTFTGRATLRRQEGRTA